MHLNACEKFILNSVNQDIKCLILNKNLWMFEIVMHDCKTRDNYKLIRFHNLLHP